MIHMAKIRSDLTGVVFIDGVKYAAGDSLPKGAVVSDSLVEKEAAAPKKAEFTKRAAMRNKSKGE